MIVVGISGPSCSGKSTLARHLRHVLPHSAVLYQDDFYFPESQLPLDAAGNSNWDCPQAFDLLAMRKALLRYRQTDELPTQDTREEHNNNIGATLLSEADTREISAFIAANPRLVNEKVLIVDGILLFHKNSELTELFDAKIAVPFNRITLKERREARAGYATPDGEYWQDPPNYFEELVWPEFEKHCGFLYSSEGDDYNRISPAGHQLGLKTPVAGSMLGMIMYVLQECVDVVPAAHPN